MEKDEMQWSTDSDGYNTASLLSAEPISNNTYEQLGARVGHTAEASEHLYILTSVVWTQVN